MNGSQCAEQFSPPACGKVFQGFSQCDLHGFFIALPIGLNKFSQSLIGVGEILADGAVHRGVRVFEIIDKYVEMNIAHPFREGNGRATRIWLDLILKRRLKKCVDWSLIDKNDYLAAMTQSVIDSSRIKQLISNALTDKIEDREVFMKGIDYSYYYEQVDE